MTTMTDCPAGGACGYPTHEVGGGPLRACQARANGARGSVAPGVTAAPPSPGGAVTALEDAPASSVEAVEEEFETTDPAELATSVAEALTRSGEDARSLTLEGARDLFGAALGSRGFEGYGEGAEEAADALADRLLANDPSSRDGRAHRFYSALASALREATPEDAPVEAEPEVYFRETGGYSGRRTTGVLYDSRRTAKEIANLLRGDFKAAVREGKLPAEYAYGVRKESYAGGQSLTVSVKPRVGAPKDPYDYSWAMRPADPNAESYRERRAAEDGHPVVRDDIDALGTTLKNMARRYTEEDVDGMTDYFDVSCYVHVRAGGRSIG